MSAGQGHRKRARNIQTINYANQLHHVQCWFIFSVSGIWSIFIRGLVRMAHEVPQEVSLVQFYNMAEQSMRDFTLNGIYNLYHQSCTPSCGRHRCDMWWNSSHWLFKKIKSLWKWKRDSYKKKGGSSISPLTVPVHVNSSTLSARKYREWKGLKENDLLLSGYCKMSG